jgi:hypothetical protein
MGSDPISAIPEVTHTCHEHSHYMHWKSYGEGERYVVRLRRQDQIETPKKWISVARRDEPGRRESDPIRFVLQLAKMPTPNIFT